MEQLDSMFPSSCLHLAVLGLLNPLDTPHHMRLEEECLYREGVVLDRPSKPGKGSFVNCGMRKVGLAPADPAPWPLSLVGLKQAGGYCWVSEGNSSLAQSLMLLLPCPLWLVSVVAFQILLGLPIPVPPCFTAWPE